MNANKLDKYLLNHFSRHSAVTLIFLYRTASVSVPIVWLLISFYLGWVYDPRLFYLSIVVAWAALVAIWFISLLVFAASDYWHRLNAELSTEKEKNNEF